MFLGGSSKRRDRPRQLQFLLPARVSPTPQAEGLHGWRGRTGRGQLGTNGTTSSAGHWWEARGVRAVTSPRGQGWNTLAITAEARSQTSGLVQHLSKSGLRRRVRQGWDAPSC